MLESRPIAVYGAGGFAREVAWLITAARADPPYRMVGYVDESPGTELLNGQPILASGTIKERFPGCAVAVAVGDPGLREKLAKQAGEEGFRFPTLCHRTVELSESVSLGEGTIICAGSILTVDIQVGRHVHVNLDCTIGHDVRIGDFTTLSPGVHVSGNVHIGRGVYIGTGAVIINGTIKEPLVIQDRCVIAAGACITKSTVGPGLYAGVPAMLKKSYS